MACGRLDIEVANKAFLSALLGKDVGEAEALRMHPLRRMEAPPPRPKSEAEKKAQSKAGWRMLRQFLGVQKKG